MKQIIVSIDAAKKTKDEVMSLVSAYDVSGADGICICNFTKEDDEKEAFLRVLREVSALTDLPLYFGGSVNRLEDVKKLFYAGADKVVISTKALASESLIGEAQTKIGAERVLLLNENGELFVSGRKPEEECFLSCNYSGEKLAEVLKQERVAGVVMKASEGENFFAIKQMLSEQGIATSVWMPFLDFAELKKNDRGLVPVVVQDYKTNEVLMLAYMNEEAYNCTIHTGKMTYYSRSRDCLWVKGETSGHFQYVKALSVDCDEDTLLAKVKQIGAACHTGQPTCFYRDLVKTGWKQENDNVLMQLYATVMDRKLHPKEGSYTNYLFDKGIDKILKKCGEEATEIVIAAKNPDQSELRYEIADFLYHVTVLMAECGLDWRAVFSELANRE